MTKNQIEDVVNDIESDIEELIHLRDKLNQKIDDQESLKQFILEHGGDK